MNRPVRTAIALGSNLGNRASFLLAAVVELTTLLEDLRVSQFRETDAVGTGEGQPRFLNAAAVGLTNRDPRSLLDQLLAIEARHGRERPYPQAPRTLDLDLILFGGLVVDEPSLVVPHPRFRERRFVLEPLVEIAPDLRDPVTGLTMSELLARLPPAR